MLGASYPRMEMGMGMKGREEDVPGVHLCYDLELILYC